MGSKYSRELFCQTVSSFEEFLGIAEYNCQSFYLMKNQHVLPKMCIKSTIRLNESKYQLIINEKLALRNSMKNLVEYLVIGLESNSQTKLGTFSTVLDRSLKAEYDLEKKRIHVKQVESILF